MHYKLIESIEEETQTSTPVKPVPQWQMTLR